MKRADELFTFEGRPSRSRMVEATWQTRSEPQVGDTFMSAAVSHWELVVTRQRGTGWVSLRGPETRAAPAPIPQEAEFFGIVFSHGTFMPGLAPERLVDRALHLPLVSDDAVWLDGSAWEVPTPDSADVFVDRLVGAGLLVHDPVVSATLQDDGDSCVRGLSTRSVERRVARATGLTRGTIRQIRRADEAVELLSQGVPALDVVRRVGYADQPHMSRSLKRFVGQTPSQLAG